MGRAFFYLFIFSKDTGKGAYLTQVVSPLIRGLQEPNPVLPHRSKVQYLQIWHAWQLYVTAVNNES